MTPEQLRTLIQRVQATPAPLPESDAAELRAAIDEYPYFPALRVLMLKAEPDSPHVRQAVAMEATSDRIMGAAARGIGAAGFYPPAPAEGAPATEDVIDRFLNTYGNVTPREEALLEKMIFNPTPDYSEILAREEQENLPEPDAGIDPESQEGRLNAFILAQHPAAPHADEPEPEPEAAEPPAPVVRPHPADDSPLSESLAQIFIKRGRYERAYEIISGLSLKFPKKSAYFADQLRFLQILIKNQRLSEGNPEPETH